MPTELSTVYQTVLQCNYREDCAEGTVFHDSPTMRNLTNWVAHVERTLSPRFGDGTRSWVMIVNAINKYVTEMSGKSKRTTSITLETVKTERNTQSDVIFSDDHITVSSAAMDKEVRRKLFRSVNKR